MAGPAGFASSASARDPISSLFDVFVKQKMAGPAGFEPANAGTKTQCLTAWRRSNLPLFYHILGLPSKPTQNPIRAYSALAFA